MKGNDWKDMDSRDKLWWWIEAGGFFILYFMIPLFIGILLGYNIGR